MKLKIVEKIVVYTFLEFAIKNLEDAMNTLQCIYFKSQILEILK